jgi:hypothetical protein
MLKNCQIAGVGVNPEIYHKQSDERGTGGFVMSSSHLREFARCPSRWRAGYEMKESDALEFGSLVDTLALTPSQFKDRYVMQPDTYTNEKGDVKPWSNNATVCREWNEDHANKVILKQKDLAEAQKAVASLKSDEVIASFLEASNTQAYVTGEWHDETHDLVIAVKALLDLVPRNDSEFYKSLCDLKTTKNASPGAWTRWCFQAQYHVQAALFFDLYVAATGEDRCNYGFILVENYPPYQTGKRILSLDFLELGRLQYRTMLKNYAWCVKNQKFPDYDQTDESVQGWSIVRPEPFMEGQVMFAPKFSDDAEPEQQPEENPDLIP